VKALLCLQLLALELLVLLDFFHMLFFCGNVELGCLISAVLIFDLKLFRMFSYSLISWVMCSAAKRGGRWMFWIVYCRGRT
jgi:hypothetical protein